MSLIALFMVFAAVQNIDNLVLAAAYGLKNVQISIKSNLLIAVASNLEFADKKMKYFRKGGIFTFAITTEVLNEAEWTPAVFEKRQGELLNLFTDLWRLG